MELNAKGFSVLKEVGELQKSYENLKKNMTKQAMCDLVVPFRDKYNLSDKDALAIARNELGIIDIAEVLEAGLRRLFWKQAQEQTKAEYEEEYGEGSWEDRADKYEREDFTFATYEKLLKIGVKTEYVVKRTEEELGDFFFKVIVPKEEIHYKVMKNFEMAAKYAQVSFCDWELMEPEEAEREYDEYFEEMGSIRNICNGDEVFEYYLTRFCGYQVVQFEEPITDFAYEW